MNENIDWAHYEDVSMKIKWILTGRGHFYKNKRIGRMVNELYEKYNIGWNSIQNLITAHYFDKDLGRKYDESRSSFELFLVGICFNCLRGFVAKCQRNKLAEHEIVRLDDPEEESKFSPRDLDLFGRNRQLDPESLCIALELKNTIDTYYDEVDMAVAMKEISYREAAEEKGISKECYKKRFQRKTEALKQQLVILGWSTLN
jgi:DNA-directed RNA polymerase specialized sigma24 family protein